MDNLLSLQTLFNGRLFEIPDYQRGYSWGTQQWDDLLEDIELLPADKDHFTGLVVLQQRLDVGDRVDNEGSQYRTFDVVDGQQRLTTLVLLLDAIRRRALAEDLSDLAGGIEKKYVRLFDRAKQPIFKLRLNDGSQPFLEKVVLADEPGPMPVTTPAQQRLRDARAHFESYLDARSSADGEVFVDWLQNLHDKVVHRLRLSSYVVEDAAEVGMIFEVMNNRGIALSDLDLVKNYVLYLGTKLDVGEHALHSDVVDAWGRVFRDLMSAGLIGRSNEEQLLRSHWLMAYDYSRRNWAGTHSFKARFNLKDYVDRHDQLLTDLRAYVSTLSDAAVAYCDILRPTRHSAFASLAHDQPTRMRVVRESDSLLRLNALATFIPLLIAVRLRYPQDGERYLSVLSLCERYAFRVFRLARRRANAGEAALFKLGFDLYHGAIDIDDVLRNLRGTLHYYNPESQFESTFELNENEPGHWYSWAGIRYFLYEYEKHLGRLAKDESVWLTWEEVEGIAREKTIEHVLPQTPTDPYWQPPRFSDEDWRVLVHDLGNLCLTKDNGSYGKKSFDEKKGAPGQDAPCYAHAGLRQERELWQCDEWTPDTIRERRDKLVEWALERWGLAPTADEPPPAIVDEEEEAAAEATLLAAS